MSKLDDMISNLYFIADNLKVLKEIQDSGDCNNCKTKDCKYKPKPGQQVRYNCPFYTTDKLIEI